MIATFETATTNLTEKTSFQQGVSEGVGGEICYVKYGKISALFS